MSMDVIIKYNIQHKRLFAMSRYPKRKLRLKIPAILLVLTALCFQAGNAYTQDTLSDSLVKERILVIQEMLDHGEKGANRWWYGWLVGYSAATLAQGAVAITSDNLPTRQDMALGAFTTLLGAAGQAFTPRTPGYAPDRLREIPGGTPEANLEKLQEAERLLEESALREKSGRSWKTHAINGAVNVGCGFIVWFGFNRTFPEGLGNVALNTTICEAQIFTQPTRAIRDYADYCQRYKPGQSLSYDSPRLTWFFTMVPGGVGMKMVF